jgi:arylsulfatase A-like enzyme
MGWMNKSKFTASLAVSVVGLCVFGQFGDTRHGQAVAAARPNILFIILDDVGIDQLKLFGFGGPLPAALPNLAKIANHGVKFTNVWAMPECSPSRAAFFTGRYPIRTGVTSAIVGNHLPQEYVSQYEATLPRVLAKAGYVSAMIGKYHLGNEKDPAGFCAPSTRGWHLFRGNMTAGPPSIDKTAGGADPSGGQACGYFQTSDAGACYTRRKGATNCRRINANNAYPNTTPARTCLQRGGLFRPNTACGANVPTDADFAKSNAYYVWSRTTVAGPPPPQWVDTSGVACEPTQNRNYMTGQQSNDGVRWWNEQTGPRMLTVSYNTMHTPLQKAPSDIVPDPTDFNSNCNPLAPERRLLNNMLESVDVEIGRMLADMGLGTLDADRRRLVSLRLRNTVVVIVGDNGSYGSTVRVADGFSPSRSKATVYQTGVWVPLIVAGAGIVQPGRDVDELVNATDLFQLFGDIAGLDVKEVVPPSHLLDSRPLMPYLTAVDAPRVRSSNFTQVAVGKFTPAPEERSWPCQLGNVCNDTLLFDRNLCEDNGGTWFGPGAATQHTSCCAVAAANTSVSINPVAQWAVRNKRYKLVELLRTDCAAPLPPDATDKPFPWAEYDTRTTFELYDLKPTATNPIGIDNADDNLLKDCPEGQDPRSCLPRRLRPTYAKLSGVLGNIKNSAQAQSTCRSLGDGNLDLRVNKADIKGVERYQGRGPSQYDINQDGETDGADLLLIQSNLGTDCMNLCERADLDRNRRINSNDMTLLAKQSGPCDPVLCGGDLDGDGTVNNRDVNMMIEAQRTCTAP